MRKYRIQGRHVNGVLHFIITPHQEVLLRITYDLVENFEHQETGVGDYTNASYIYATSAEHPLFTIEDILEKLSLGDWVNNCTATQWNEFLSSLCGKNKYQESIIENNNGNPKITILKNY